MKNNKKTQNGVYRSKSASKSADLDINYQSAKTRKRGKNKQLAPKSRIDNASFLALLIRSFVSFSLIIILGVVAIFGVVSWAVTNQNVKMKEKSIADYAVQLKSGKYSDVPATKLFGKGGWLEISDKNGKVVYSTQTEPNTYTKGELDWIQKFGSNETMVLHKLSDDPYYYLIVKTYYDESGQKQDQFLALDSSYRVLSGNIPTTAGKTFTVREFDFLTYNAVHDKQTLTKYTFEGNDGETYYAIMLDQHESKNTAAYIVVIIIGACILALFAGVMVLYVRYINKHVQKPLDMLERGMASFANGEKIGHLDYKGSKEFEHLYDSFNEMVDVLGASEKQRKALEEDKQRMLAGLSHDLKTPVTIIQGFTKAIKDGLVSEEDKQKYLQIILNKSTQMGDLINQFYEYNKLEHPDFALERKRQDVAELARTFLAGIYDEFELRGYNLDTQITEERLDCDVDAKQLTRVFENVVSNFFKYTPQGTTLLFVAEKAENKAVIRIADNGPGINDESKNDVFEAFVVGEKSRKGQGSGLGLAVCKKIIEMHGGTITLAKEPIEGYSTQFDITLDLAEEK